MSSEQLKRTVSTGSTIISGDRVNGEDQVVPCINEVSDDSDPESFVIVDGNIPEDDRTGQNQQPGPWFGPMTTWSNVIVNATSGWWQTPMEENRYCPKMKFIAEQLNGVENLDDELKKRGCMVKALASHGGNIIEDKILKDEDMEELKRDKCLSSRDIEYITSQSSNSTKMNTLYLILLMRDYRTMLMFLACLKNEVFEMIVATYNQLLQSEVKSAIPRPCPHCILTSTVNIIYVAPRLMFCDVITWRSLCRAAIGVIGDMEKSEELWHMLFDTLQQKPEQKQEVLDCITKALDECGFHSDVVKMLREDQEKGTDSLQCRKVSTAMSIEVQRDPYPALESQHKADKSSGPSSLKRKNGTEDSNNQTKRKTLYGDKSNEDKSSVHEISNLKIGIQDYDEGIFSLSPAASCNSDVSGRNDETRRKYTVADADTQTSLLDNTNNMTAESTTMDLDKGASISNLSMGDDDTRWKYTVADADTQTSLVVSTNDTTAESTSMDLDKGASISKVSMGDDDTRRKYTVADADTQTSLVVSTNDTTAESTSMDLDKGAFISKVSMGDDDTRRKYTVADADTQTSLVVSTNDMTAESTSMDYEASNVEPYLNIIPECKKNE